MPDLARSQCASGRSCDRPTRSMFSVVFIGPRANAELVPKFHVALHVSHAALSMLTWNISPKCSPPDVELKFLGWNPFNAEWTKHQEILIDWPSVVTWLWHWLDFRLDHPIPEGYIYRDLSLQIGGGLEYLHLSPASRKGRRKGNPNPVPGCITGPSCSWGI
jgi:hypothetical protein